MLQVLINIYRIQNVFFLLFFMVPVVFWGQEVVLLHETFDQENNLFWTGKKDKITGKIKKGSYVISNKEKKGITIPLKFEGLDPNVEDFTIELSLKQVSGKVNTEYGFNFSVNADSTYCNTFSINGLGDYKFLQVFGKKNYLKHKSREEEAFLPGKNFNVLKIVKRANIISYFINNKLLHEDGYNSFFDKDLHLAVGPKMTVEIDFLKIKKQPKVLNLIKKPIESGKRRKLNSNINSKYAEILPIITADGRTMYFIRQGHHKNVGIRTNIDDQDIWVSRNKKGQWSKSYNIGKSLNNEAPNAVISVSPSHNSMILSQTYGRFGRPAGTGLSMTKRTRKGWSAPKSLVITDYYNLSPYNNFFICPDNITLLFSIERKYSYGQRDLYVSFLQADGRWSRPLNMGPTLNTFGDESSPFMASDNRTLYFSSEGHHGHGYYDLFATTRLDDSWTDWSTPQNLGPTINTPTNDQSLFADAKGEYLYLATDGDIYILKNPKKQDPVVLLYGHTINKKTKKPMSVEISYYDIKTGKELGISTSSPETGEYKIILPSGKKYTYEAKKKGYFAISNFLDLTDLKSYTEDTTDLYLVPIQEGEVFPLNNLFFDYDKAALQKESELELNRLHQLLLDNPKIDIEIGGHSDDKGSKDYNLKLSQKRADAVVQFLLDKGIANTRIKGVGYGESQPLYPNNSEKNRATNRRVEFRILKF